MSEHNKHKTTEKTDKPNVRDLTTHKDVKGGGGLKPASPGTGGTQTQPVPNPGSGS
jgi:hypothetical protein